MKIDNFVNRYSLSKTLRFKLTPIGETAKYFNQYKILSNDEELAKDFDIAKIVCDRYHKYFIENALEKLRFDEDDLERYSRVYYSSNKDSVKDIKDIEKKLASKISDHFKKEGCNDLLKKDIIGLIINAAENSGGYYFTFENAEERRALENLKKYATYFTNYHSIRENLYSKDIKHGTIAFRLLRDNLPIFLNNCKHGKEIISQLRVDDINLLKETIGKNIGVDIESVFSLSYYNNVLTQSGIDKYNTIIGGYTDGQIKYKGMNELVNISEIKGLPKLKTLNKQILSDRNSFSFLPKQFSDENGDEELLIAIKEYYRNDVEDCKSIESIIEIICDRLKNIDKVDLSKVYVSSDYIETLSNDVFDDWSAIRNGIYRKYEEEHPFNGKNKEKYEKDRKMNLDKIEEYSIDNLQEMMQCENSIVSYIKDEANELLGKCKNGYNAFEKNVLNVELYKKLRQDEEKILYIKSFLDNIKAFQRFVKAFESSNIDCDIAFYDEYSTFNERIGVINQLYDKCRNYLTKKPYSENKIKINFGNSQLLNGWDINKEREYLNILLLKDGQYYLGIINNKVDDKQKTFDQLKIKGGARAVSIEYSAEDCFNGAYKKVGIKNFVDPKKMLPHVFIPKDRSKIDKDIARIYDGKTFKKQDNKGKQADNFSFDDMRKLIDYFKNGIMNNPDWDIFGFEFSDTKEYDSIDEFFAEVSEQGYVINFTDIPCSVVDSLVDEGKLFLFKFDNKDFRPASEGKEKGKKNLHTMYFEAIFDERNVKDVVYALNGGGELFYRPASLTPTITHPKNREITNKTYEFRTNGEGSQKSVFAYDLIKDKRYTEDQFTLHCPITMNYKSDNVKNGDINKEVRDAIRKCNDNYVIGIDRGERNLVYVCVINENGEIIEQRSLNILDCGFAKVDYHKMLEAREHKMKESKRNWNKVESIKEMKQGYMSYVVKIICDLVVKYDAIVALEDLNYSFKSFRQKFDRQVYQQFEKALSDKMRYIVGKETDPESNGGLYRAYQLANKEKKEGDKQCGFIFYVPAWNTSKIDPTTGFVNLLHERYKSILESQLFFDKFKNISFDEEKGMFRFDIKYSDFGKTIDHKDDWSVFSNGERLSKRRDKNGVWEDIVIDVNKELMQLFDKFNIDYRKDLKPQIVSQNSKEFFETLYWLFALVVQMRNSDKDNDYILSPVLNENNEFFDSRNSNCLLPIDADANGAYHIALKALWNIKQIKTIDENNYKNVSVIKEADWLRFAQNKEWKTL